MEYVIETRNLVKRFGYKCAVDNISIHLEKGEIYGLIGKNGAGKTTLLKLILGLIKPNEGEILINGSSQLNEERIKIGSLIESPGLYRGKTAERNLQDFAVLFGADFDEIPDLLKLVGLENVGKKKVKAFSLGMKQRLGLAIALLGHPEILLLDEPVNGLDPEGIKSFRDIIEKLHSERNITVIISSHLLDELGKIATKYGIVNNGKLVEEKTIEEIEKECGEFLKVETTNNESAVALIKKEFPDAKCEIIDNYIKVLSSIDIRSKLISLLVKENIDVNSCAITHNDVESFFIERLK